jgi:hypothetical protein
MIRIVNIFECDHVRLHDRSQFVDKSSFCGKPCIRFFKYNVLSGDTYYFGRCKNHHHLFTDSSTTYTSVSYDEAICVEVMAS